MKRFVIAASFCILLFGIVSAQDPYVDLPCHPFTPTEVKPILPIQPAQPIVRADLPPETDPVDEPLPVFFGEELKSESASVVFVIDISGSMKFPTTRKMDLAKAELCRAIQSLPPDWRFGMVSFESDVRPWNNHLVTATPDVKADACYWVRSLIPGGETATYAGVVAGLAMDRDNTYVVLLTDGAPTIPVDIPEIHRTVIRNNNWQRARIDVFGIEANTQAMRSFCMGIASDNSGSYYDVR